MTGSILGDGVWVHHGVWYNHEEKMGIITLTSQEANYLLAAIALYVTFYSQDFWYALRWLLHAFRYKDPNPQHVVHHQLQVALRNSGNPGSYMFKVIMIWWHWRKVAVARAWRRCLPEVIHSVLLFAGWILAGVFLSVYLEEVPKDVLLVPSSTCGMEYKNWTLQPEEQLPWLRYRKTILSNVMPRVEGCYLGNWTDEDCSFYPAPRFELDGEAAECPLADPAACISTPIAFDIGPIRSDHDLGIDTKPEDAVYYKRSVTCSPIDLDLYVVSMNESEAGASNGTIPTTFDIGYHVINNKQNNITLTLVNVTKTALSGYFMQSYQDADPESSIYWEPKAEIFPTDGNWNLFMLRQVGLRYTSPLNDPFLKATTPAPAEDDDSLYYQTNLTMADDLYTAIACRTQHQFCTPKQNCTQSLGLKHLGDSSSYDSLPWSPTQKIIVERIVNQTSQFAMASVVQDLATSALQASQSLNDDINVGDFTDMQWTKEVQRWIAASLAILQYQTTWFVNGLADQTYDTSVMVEGRPELKALCTRQRVGQTGVNTRNFHMKGVLAVFLVGVLVNTAGLLGAKLNDLCQRFRSSDVSAKQWAQDGLFQLHRRHLEKQGVEGWTGIEDEVPIANQTVVRSTSETSATDILSKENATMSVTEIA